MVAAPAKLNHLLTIRTRLPALSLCNVHELHDIPVLQTEAIVLLVLARSARLLVARNTCGYACYNVGRSDPLRACTVAAVGRIQCLKLFSFSFKSGDDCWGQQRDAAEKRYDFGTTTGREL